MQPPFQVSSMAASHPWWRRTKAASEHKVHRNCCSNMHLLLFICIIYHRYGSTSLLPNPCDIHSKSFLHFSTPAFAALHSACTPICSLPLLFFIHTLRLRGSFINSTTPYSSKKKGGERVVWREGCPYWLTDCCMVRAPWKPKTANAEAERGGWVAEGDSGEERGRGKESIRLKLHSPSPPLPPLSFIQSFIHSSKPPSIHREHSSSTAVFISAEDVSADPGKDKQCSGVPVCVTDFPLVKARGHCRQNNLCCLCSAAAINIRFISASLRLRDYTSNTESGH